MALVGMARRPNASADLKAVCTGIGAELRKLLSNVLHEPIPEGMAELLRQLDQPTAKPPDVNDG
jgi:Anti-sigma factor NepR